MSHSHLRRRRSFKYLVNRFGEYLDSQWTFGPPPEWTLHELGALYREVATSLPPQHTMVSFVQALVTAQILEPTARGTWRLVEFEVEEGEEEIVLLSFPTSYRFPGPPPPPPQGPPPFSPPTSR